MEGFLVTTKATYKMATNEREVRIRTLQEVAIEGLLRMGEVLVLVVGWLYGK